MFQFPGVIPFTEMDFMTAFPPVLKGEFCFPASFPVCFYVINRFHLHPECKINKFFIETPCSNADDETNPDPSG
jgi:hypothetical protein